MAIEPGLEGSVEAVVGAEDTAPALGSGDVGVLGTPRIVALCEEAAVRAVSASLPAGQTSVGTRIDLHHTAPTVPGRRVVARAWLERVEGRTLEFSVEAADDAGPVAHGRHARVVVDRTGFVEAASAR